MKWLSVLIGGTSVFVSIITFIHCQPPSFAQENYPQGMRYKDIATHSTFKFYNKGGQRVLGAKPNYWYSVVLNGAVKRGDNRLGGPKYMGYYSDACYNWEAYRMHDPSRGFTASPNFGTSYARPSGGYNYPGHLYATAWFRFNANRLLDIWFNPKASRDNRGCIDAVVLELPPDVNPGEYQWVEASGWRHVSGYPGATNRPSEQGVDLLGVPVR